MNAYAPYAQISARLGIPAGSIGPTRRREVGLVIVPTAQAITVLAKTTKDTNAILHLTC